MKSDNPTPVAKARCEILRADHTTQIAAVATGKAILDTATDEAGNVYPLLHTMKPIGALPNFNSVVTFPLNAFAEEVHADNVRAGWWTDLHTGESLVGKRNAGELLCLVHSEISEAWHGRQNSLMDDKLPHRAMEEVEFADVLIRIFDIAGAYEFDLETAARGAYIETRGFLTTLTEAAQYADLHRHISEGMEGYRKSNLGKAQRNLAIVILKVIVLCSRKGYDLWGAIAEKRAFNASRADHKPENRRAEGGKAF